jgi:hypothetical protein
MTTYSSNLLLQEQTPGDPAVRNAWGTNLNNGVIALVDTAIAGQLSLTITGGTTILTSNPGAADQSRNTRFKLSGTLTSNATILWPQGLGRRFSVVNGTSGAFTVTLGANNGSGSPAGTTQTVTQGATAVYYSDGTNVTPEFAVSGGTVGSVGLADTSGSPIFNISNSPITTSGTIDMTLANQSAAQVFAGPATGSAAQPTFRSLATTDFPSAGQNTVLAGPLSGGSGTPTYRALTSADGVMTLTGTAQPFSGGVRLTSFNLGTLSSFTVDPGNGPAQYGSNTGAFTMTSPAHDGACDILITNGAGAGAVTFSGFTVSSNTGDALDTTNGHKFIVSVRCINGTGTYLIKALQ